MKTRSLVIAVIFALPLGNVWASGEPNIVFKSEKSRSGVGATPDGQCVVALRSDTGINIVHDATAAIGKSEGIWLFTTTGASLVTQASGLFSDGSEKKILLDRENDLIKILLFEKELKRSKTFTIVITSFKGLDSKHVFDLSDFDQINEVVKSGCKKPTSLWQSLKDRVKGGKE